ncbi:MAG TPA: hypothetical protein VEB66_08275 [Opitutaceae bacterium]|nr:hypothetical protein [Opitutaceae bacterium]
MSLPPFPATGLPVKFGADENRVGHDGGLPQLQVALPVLAGAEGDPLLDGVERTEAAGAWTLLRRDDRLAGFAVAPAGQPLEAAAAGLYAQLFAATRGWHLGRIWNYVPEINRDTAGLENYRHFCRGRSLAFEREFGAGFARSLPAASAVGTGPGRLAVAFLAVPGPVGHHENPRQVPAFEYPRQYGPRPPAFARATVIEEDGARTVFVSGTAAIRGHATVAPGDLSAQLACTLENLAAIAAAAGAGAGTGAGWARSFRVFLRRSADYPAVARALGRELLTPDDKVQYLRADICRGALLVEIEAQLTRRA